MMESLYTKLITIFETNPGSGEVSDEEISMVLDKLKQAPDMTKHNEKNEEIIGLLKIVKTLLRFQQKNPKLNVLGTIPIMKDVFMVLLNPKYHPSIRDEALRCLNNAVFGCTEELRTKLMGEGSNEELISALRLNIVPLLNNSEKNSSAGELGRVFRVLLVFFTENPITGKHASNIMLKSGIVASTIHALARTVYDVSFPKPKTFPITQFKPKFMAITLENRILLTTGFKFLFAVALLDTMATATALIDNEGREKCTMEELAVADISPQVESIRGMGDLYAFVALHILSASPVNDPAIQDVQNQIASMLTLSDSAKGFAQYLFQMGGVHSLVRILKARVDQVYEMSENNGTRGVSSQSLFDLLVPIILALDTVGKDHKPIVDYLRNEVVFSADSLLDPLDPEDYLTEEEFKEAANQRTTDGHLKPESFGGMLKNFMMSTETNLKRIVSEFMWTLCNESAREMTKLCGYGAAVHIIAIKAGTIGQLSKQQGVVTQQTPGEE